MSITAKQYWDSITTEDTMCDFQIDEHTRMWEQGQRALQKLREEKRFGNNKGKDL